MKKLLPNENKTMSDKIKLNNIEETEDCDVAEKFNEYFVSSIEEICRSIPKINDHDFVISRTEKKGVFSSFNIITMPMMESFINRL